MNRIKEVEFIFNKKISAYSKIQLGSRFAEMLTEVKQQVIEKLMELEVDAKCDHKCITICDTCSSTYDVSQFNYELKN